MHPAVQARLDNLQKRGIFPGNDTGIERKVGTATVHDFDYCQMWAFPGLAEAWALPDIEHAWRFLQRPAGV